jgi:uncharacterized membrane protein HdeD (DUF308 family)
MSQAQAQPVEANRGDQASRFLFELGLEQIRIVGIVLLVLGVLAVIVPAFAGTLVSLVVGIVLLAAGLSKIIRIYRTKAWKHWEDVLLSVLAILGGGLIVAKPLVGLAAITLSLVAYFAISGIVQLLWWWRLRRAVSALWTLLAGVVTLLLAVLMGIGWPVSGLWAVGTLVGIHLLFGGASLITLASPPRAGEAAAEVEKNEATAEVEKNEPTAEVEKSEED